MKAFPILILFALLAHAAPAQTNVNTDAAAAARAERARQLLRGNTNTFRPATPVIPQPVAVVTNATTPVAPPVTTPVAPAVTTPVAPAVTAPVQEVELPGPAPMPLPRAAATPPATATATATNVTTVAPTAPVAAQPQIRFPTIPPITAETGAAPGPAGPAPFAGPAAPNAAEINEPRDVDAGTLDFKGTPIDQILETYQALSGRTVLRPYAMNVQITLRNASPMTKREAIQALDSALALNGIVMIPLGELFVKAVPAAQADREGTDIDLRKASELPDAEQFITKIVTLKTAKAAEVVPVLQPFGKSPTSVTPIDSNNSIVLRDYAANVKRMLDLIEKIDVLPEKDFTLEVIPIRYGKVGDIYATMSSLISGGGGGGGVGGSGFRSTGVGGGGGGFGGMGNSMMNRNSMNNRGGYNSMNRGYNQQYGNNYGNNTGTMYQQQVAQPSVAANQANFNSRLNNIIQRASQPEQQQILENANIVPDERSNKLLIFANKRDMAMITNIVSKVDVLLAQVLIEAVILEVSLGDTLNYGVSAFQRQKQFTENFGGAGVMRNSAPFFNAITNFPNGSPNGFTYLASFGDSFEVAITALASDRKANVISRPRIQTSHAIPGNIFVGETRPYITGFSDYAFGSSVSTRSQVQEKIIGLTLDVTPYITPEGFVVMELVQQFDSFKGNLEVEGNPYPLVDSRSASSMLTVRNGDLIMLGGFITDSSSKTKTGVPFLKDIPGLGVLFRSNTSDTTRTELIILMKATVLDTPEQAAFLAAQERATLPGIREAELNQQKEDEKRTKKLNKKEKKGF